ncbi:MAG TPA: DUF3488 and transglutaminase-like domain-containing protein [Nocardioides sp.]|nr:DUF3488 and transglutaminase-like domain-containing protein [Nocardioides sp.]
MSRLRGLWPETGVVALAGALATWLALLSWAPFHERPGTYVVPLLGIALAVALTGTALRALRAPVAVVAVLQLAALFVWFNHEWAAALSWQGWLPTGSSVAEVGATLSAAVETARAYEAPIGAEITTFAPLMLASGAVVAVVVDVIAAGLRRAPVAGLPLLAVYTAPVSILERGVPWWAFAFAGVGFLVLVAAQEETRLSRWGRNVSGSGRLQDSQGTGVSPGAVWGSARRIGLTATGLAVVVPLAVPTLSLSFFDGPGRGAGGGGDAVTVDNPMVNMRRDLSRGTDVDMVRVRTDDPDVGYLRIAVLDDYQDGSWSPGERERPPEQRADGPVTPPPGLDEPDAARSYTWDVEVLGEFDTDWLPTPYPVGSIVAEGDWRYSRDTLDFTSFDSQDARGMAYRLQRLVVEPAADALAFAQPAPASVFGPNTALPESVPAFVEELAAEVTADGRTRYEKAVALQQWFRTDGGFRYSLRPAPGTDVDDLERFLTEGPDGRTGYCEQFAAAMALMGRALNIPSRVAVGFLRPEEEDEGVYVYSAHDMHAWPEMYFEGTGWVRFEPTPGGSSYGVPSYTRQDVNRPDADPSASASASSTPGVDPSTGRSLDPGDLGGSGDGGISGGPLAGYLLGGAAGALIALAPRLSRAWVRRRRWAAATTAPALAEAAWDELRDTALDHGVAWDDRVTLRTRTRALVAGFGKPGSVQDALGRSSERGPGAHPEAEDALERLVVLVERARFSRGLPVDAATAEEVQADVATCAAALRAGVSRSRARRAEWLPASLWSHRLTPWRRRGGFSLGEAGVDRAV